MVHDVLCDCGAPVPYPGGRCDRWPRGCSRYYSLRHWVALLILQGQQLPTTCRHRNRVCRVHEYLARDTDGRLIAVCPLCRQSRKLTRDEEAAVS